MTLSVVEKEMDKRNVTDFYKSWMTEDILSDLDLKRNNFSILCSNLIRDFNIGTVVRNSNAFLSKEILIYGKRNWDRRGAVGTQNYSHFKMFKEIEDLNNLKEYVKDYYIVGIDNVDGAVPINNFKWPKDKHVLMVFGEENSGITKDLLDLCHSIVFIKQLGSVRSINVGSASAIAMYSYCESLVY
jgi:tRNA G18 (ribose-2'-O)-methylase SpoU